LQYPLPRRIVAYLSNQFSLSVCCTSDVIINCGGKRDVTGRRYRNVSLPIKTRHGRWLAAPGHTHFFGLLRLH